MDSLVCFASRLAACFCRRTAISCATSAALVAASSSAVRRAALRSCSADMYCSSVRSCSALAASLAILRRISAISCWSFATSSEASPAGAEVSSCDVSTAARGVMMASPIVTDFMAEFGVVTTVLDISCCCFRAWRRDERDSCASTLACSRSDASTSARWSLCMTASAAAWVTSSTRP